MERQTETKQGTQVQKAMPAPEVSLYEEMDRLFDDFFSGSWPRPWRLPRSTRSMGRTLASQLPRVDVIDRDGEVVVKAEVPGVDKKDLDISLTEDSVTINGSSRHEQKEEKGDYYRCEIYRGEFSRTVALPAAVDTAKAKASFKDGVLELVITKLEARTRCAIKID